MLRNTEDLEAMDRAYVFHPSTHLRNHAHGDSPCRIVDGGEGVFIRDHDGRRLLDAFGGLYCVNIGYGRKEIADAIYRQAQELAYYHAYAGHTHQPVIELSKGKFGVHQTSVPSPSPRSPRALTDEGNRKAAAIAQALGESPACAT